MLKLSRFFNLALLSLAFSSTAQAMITANTTIIGTVETVAVHDLGMKMPARIDTGASMTSVHAEIIKITPGKKGQPDKVVFNVSDHNGNKKRLEKDIERWVLIKKKNNEGTLRRPVVMMEFCLGGKTLEGQTNLANRSRFKYPLLIGRNVLASGDYLVNAGKEYAHKGGCQQS